MSKEKEFKFSSATVEADKSIHAGFDLDSGDWEAKQDITQYKKQAQLDRDKQEYFGHRKDGYRKLATIPDIVAIKMLEDHGINLHSPEFMRDPANMKKLKYVLRTEYADLLVNN